MVRWRNFVYTSEKAWSGQWGSIGSHHAVPLPVAVANNTAKEKTRISSRDDDAMGTRRAILLPTTTHAPVAETRVDFSFFPLAFTCLLAEPACAYETLIRNARAAGRTLTLQHCNCYASVNSVWWLFKKKWAPTSTRRNAVTFPS